MLAVAAVAMMMLVANDSGPACFISGEVYSTQSETKASLAPTNCPINIEQQGHLITMTSPKWIVQVQIPADIGKQEFLYQWGDAEAKIGEKNVEVFYKPVGGA
jgi:hypothetical protein